MCCYSEVVSFSKIILLTGVLTIGVSTGQCVGPAVTGDWAVSFNFVALPTVKPMGDLNLVDGLSQPCWGARPFVRLASGFGDS